MKNNFRDHSTVVYIIFFVIAVVIILITSILYKTVRMVQQSSFTSDSFNILVVGENAYAVHVNTVEKQMSFLTIRDIPQLPYYKDNLTYSILLGIPIHGVIYDNKKEAVSDIDSFFSLSHVINLASNPRYKKNGLNTVDLIKVYFASESTPRDNIRSGSVSKKDFNFDNFPKVDETLYTLFKEPDIINQKISVEIINDTDINGLGGRVARVLENWGYDVVSIISDQKQTKSQVIVRTKSPRVQRDIGKIFQLPVTIKNDQSIADITIILGDDISSKVIL